MQAAINAANNLLLTGKTPADVSIPPAPLAERVPIVPTTVPSALLERRPDIAEVERQMKEENSLIGVQVAAYFPTINLSAVFGYAGNPGTALFSTSSEVWTLMASASQSILNRRPTFCRLGGCSRRLRPECC